MTDTRDIDSVEAGRPAPTVTAVEVVSGISLRDWFAGQALAGLLEYPGLVNSVGNTTKLAYKYADAMLAERAKK